jgi:GMP synthase (glutamine-hydrolysing)
LKFTIVKTGQTLPDIAAEHGDFELWFAKGLGVPVEDLRLVSSYLGEELPDPAKCEAVVVTGSAALVTDHASWSVQTGEWMKRVFEAEKPMLAVCYGHQLLAEVMGGRVATNPNGREIGTIQVELNEEGKEDALLGVFGPVLAVQSTHIESVVELPPGAVRLGTTPLDPNQIYRLGPKTWATQFHPEFKAEVIRSYIEARREAIDEEGLGAQTVLDGVQKSEVGTNILRRFAELARGM